MFRKTTGRTRERDGGFTFIEAMLSLIVLGLMTVTISGAVFSGLRAREAQQRGFLIDSAARSLMERLVSHPADQLWGGAMDVDIDGETVRMYYYAEGVDLDGNGHDDFGVLQVRVVIEEVELITIMANDYSMVRKIS